MKQLSVQLPQSQVEVGVISQLDSPVDLITSTNRLRQTNQGDDMQPVNFHGPSQVISHTTSTTDDANYNNSTDSPPDPINVLMNRNIRQMLRTIYLISEAFDLNDEEIGQFNAWLQRPPPTLFQLGDRALEIYLDVFNQDRQHERVPRADTDAVRSTANPSGPDSIATLQKRTTSTHCDEGPYGSGKGRRHPSDETTEINHNDTAKPPRVGTPATI